ncbi:hypothetical protein QVD17_11877 [Tagetes erecta]|uniref:Uncharacterized protein n=1 Tax=Tagetes erecta TaxID=13708 RepID=A0AAD8P1A5_TARER|nr:hypothetical protein QVD17_11877 [Tagetes erecta]
MVEKHKNVLNTGAYIGLGVGRIMKLREVLCVELGIEIDDELSPIVLYEGQRRYAYHRQFNKEFCHADGELRDLVAAVLHINRNLAKPRWSSAAVVVSLLEGYNELSSPHESVLHKRGDETAVTEEVTDVAGASAVVLAEWRMRWWREPVPMA